MTPVKYVYDAFFSLITDDMYLELTPEETRRDCDSMLLQSLPLFEFPSKPIRLIKDENTNHFIFNRDLTLEEINILAKGMVQIWIQRQINTIELTRQKYTGPDFKMTSQASHLGRLMNLLSATRDEHRRLQMLNTRRRESANGERYESNFDLFVKPMH